MNVPIEGKDIVFIDDVLYTGRSIRAALTAIESYGRPKSIELLNLIDRRFSRDLPIQPDYVGRQIDALQNDKVTVEWTATHKEDAVYLLKIVMKTLSVNHLLGIKYLKDIYTLFLKPPTTSKKSSIAPLKRCPVYAMLPLPTSFLKTLPAPSSLSN